jgi:exodeoxyribonuclease VII small subunit
MSNTQNKPTFEEAIAELENIVESMESGKLTLNECVEKYQRGEKLAGVCKDALEAAEKKLQVLEKDGTLSDAHEEDAVPF